MRQFSTRSASIQQRPGLMQNWQTCVNPTVPGMAQLQAKQALLADGCPLPSCLSSLHIRVQNLLRKSEGLASVFSYIRWSLEAFGLKVLHWWHWMRTRCTAWPPCDLCAWRERMHYAGWVRCPRIRLATKVSWAGNSFWRDLAHSLILIEDELCEQFKFEKSLWIFRVHYVLVYFCQLMVC